MVLGFWDGHDSGAALFDGGRLVAAINEERLTRRKLEICFPRQSIAACLEIAGVTAADVERVAVSTADVAKTLARWLPATKETYYAIRRRRVAPGRFAGLQKHAKYWITEAGSRPLLRRLSAAALRAELMQLGLGLAPLEVFDHHECHAAAAAWASGFDTCAAITVDGVGDGLSSTISTYRDGRLERVAASKARDSLGIFFEHVTNLLNMRELEDEGKVMALADFAAPVPDDRNPLLSLFTVRDGIVRSPIPGRSMMSHLRSVQWAYPNEQFASMAQRTVEHVYVLLARDAVRLTGLRRLAIAGGVASNVKANRRVRLLPEVESVHVFPHMGDGGLAAGAAVLAMAAEDRSRSAPLADLALGCDFSDEDIRAALEKRQVVFTAYADLVDQVAELIAAGRIVMWFQGPMEYGPRALGHRSVLARPDLSSLRDRLNLVLKQRVWYQPFCPSMLESDARRILEDYSGPPNRHMTMAYMVRPELRDVVAGVTSVDGSCRPQIIPDHESTHFGALLRAVKRATGSGIVLNTSFNIHGEPLVCTPDEAIDVYQRAGADALAIGSNLLVQPERQPLA